MKENFPINADEEHSLNQWISSMSEDFLSVVLSRENIHTVEIFQKNTVDSININEEQAFSLLFLVEATGANKLNPKINQIKNRLYTQMSASKECDSLIENLGKRMVCLNEGLSKLRESGLNNKLEFRQKFWDAYKEMKSLHEKQSEIITKIRDRNDPMQIDVDSFRNEKEYEALYDDKLLDSKAIDGFWKYIRTDSINSETESKIIEDVNKETAEFKKIVDAFVAKYNEYVQKSGEYHEKMNKDIQAILDEDKEMYETHKRIEENCEKIEENCGKIEGRCKRIEERDELFDMRYQTINERFEAMDRLKNFTDGFNDQEIDEIARDYWVMFLKRGEKVISSLETLGDKLKNNNKLSDSDGKLIIKYLVALDNFKDKSRAAFKSCEKSIKEKKKPSVEILSEAYKAKKEIKEISYELTDLLGGPVKSGFRSIADYYAINIGNMCKMLESKLKSDPDFLDKKATIDCKKTIRNLNNLYTQALDITAQNEIHGKIIFFEKGKTYSIVEFIRFNSEMNKSKKAAIDLINFVQNKYLKKIAKDGRKDLEY